MIYVLLLFLFFFFFNFVGGGPGRDDVWLWIQQSSLSVTMKKWEKKLWCVVAVGFWGLVQ
jgi:hypothetical protein